MDKPTKQDLAENRETEKILSDAEKLNTLAHSPGWDAAKSLLINKVSQMDSISTVINENRTDEDIVKEMKLRDSVRNIILTWLAEVEGSANIDQYNKDVKVTREQSIIRIYN